MGMFKCQDCGTRENTALGSFWGQERKLCSECARGKWHGMFDKRPWDPARDVGYVDGFYRDPKNAL